ncbi:putative L-lactate dehydrogenase [Rosellinia necatrix]|uniref:L-lactate dehydrogenase (cytochrome) n=1 Tax=Rosellinia necatrix TaxID=77044 RepID=A0A1S7UK28_ROSNE|nr:putative L-lactate dehydrogenase [Rosellinia necatrix]
MAEKLISAEEVAKHTALESCWVVLYGNVYDVTEFLPSHPGGSKIILKLAGRDATEEYDPIHPPGTLEENLKPEARLGRVDPATIAEPPPPPPPAQAARGPGEKGEEGENDGSPPPMETLLNLDEIEQVARRRISAKAWAYYWSASDDLWTKANNNAVYRAILLRPRVFVDCTRCDLTTALLGGQHAAGLPIFVSPAAMARLAHPDGEAAIARACARFGAVQIVSNNASLTPEQIVAGAGAGAGPGQAATTTTTFGWQLYVQTDRAKSEAMLARINAMPEHFKFICLTLDAPVPGKRELDEKQNFGGASAAARVTAGVKSPGDPVRPGGGGVGQQLFWGTAADLTWEPTLAWLRRHTDLPIVLKGVQTHEDAWLAARHAPQVRGIILSNHGGRALDTAPPAVHTLLEIRKYCPDVFGRLDVWVDGGIRRGTDVVKALALGAKAVGIGRAALFGLGAGGQEGVERTLEILRDETITCMKLLGVKNVSELGPQHVNARKVERDIFDGDANLETSGLWEKVRSRL